MRTTFRGKSLLRSVCTVAVLTTPLFARPSNASVALLMEEPYGHFGAWNPTGHAAVYLDRVCAETPTTVDSREEEEDLRNKYWREHLTELIPSKNGNAPKGNWTQLVGSSFDRTSHVFQAPTTPEQDDRFIESFNNRRNKSHFNLFFHNCADFSRVVLNTYFPGAVRRNYIADFGFTTPKQAARRMVEYGKAHPDVPVTQMVLPQVDGRIARSHRIRGVSESLVKTKRWLFPLLVVEPEAVGVAAVAYFTTGRARFQDNAPVFPIVQPAPPFQSSTPVPEGAETRSAIGSGQ